MLSHVPRREHRGSRLVYFHKQRPLTQSYSCPSCCDHIFLGHVTLFKDLGDEFRDIWVEMNLLVNTNSLWKIFQMFYSVHQRSKEKTFSDVKGKEKKAVGISTD